jgi:serine/arginine repetitive matrix protein 2
MSYNGVGLSSVRGSGTNGYVTTNKAYVRPVNVRHATSMNAGHNNFDDWDMPKQRQANEEILEHQRKRKIEVKIAELRDAMEDRGYSEIEIEEKCAEVRTALSSKASSAVNGTDSHASAKLKESENDRMKGALGIRSDFVEGEAFDQDLQEQRKKERLDEREAKQRQKEKEEREWQKEQKRREKEAKRQAREHAKAAAAEDRKPPLRDGDRGRSPVAHDRSDGDRRDGGQWREVNRGTTRSRDASESRDDRGGYRRDDRGNRDAARSSEAAGSGASPKRRRFDESSGAPDGSAKPSPVSRKDRSRSASSNGSDVRRSSRDGGGRRGRSNSSSSSSSSSSGGARSR